VEDDHIHRESACQNNHNMHWGSWRIRVWTRWNQDCNYDNDYESSMYWESGYCYFISELYPSKYYPLMSRDQSFCVESIADKDAIEPLGL
jgi:hypothetical protein